MGQLCARTRGQRLRVQEMPRESDCPSRARIALFPRSGHLWNRSVRWLAFTHGFAATVLSSRLKCLIFKEFIVRTSEGHAGRTTGAMAQQAHPPPEMRKAALRIPERLSVAAPGMAVPEAESGWWGRVRSPVQRVHPESVTFVIPKMVTNASLRQALGGQPALR